MAKDIKRVGTGRNPGWFAPDTRGASVDNGESLIPPVVEPPSHEPAVSSSPPLTELTLIVEQLKQQRPVPCDVEMNPESRRVSCCGQSELCGECPEYSVDEVIPRLWVGGGFYTIPEGVFDLVITCDPYVHEENPAPAGTREHVLSFEDGDMPALSLIDEAQELLEEYEGQRVLVRCHAGLNRSAMLVGVRLRSLGFEGDETVRLLRVQRKRRGYVSALSNPRFKRHVRDLGGAPRVIPDDWGTPQD